MLRTHARNRLLNEIKIKSDDNIICKQHGNEYSPFGPTRYHDASWFIVRVDSPNNRRRGATDATIVHINSSAPGAEQTIQPFNRLFNRFQGGRLETVHNKSIERGSC